MTKLQAARDELDLADIDLATIVEQAAEIERSRRIAQKRVTMLRAKVKRLDPSRGPASVLACSDCVNATFAVGAMSDLFQHTMGKHNRRPMMSERTPVAT